MSWLEDVLRPIRSTTDAAEAALLSDRGEVLRRLIAQVKADAGSFAQQELKLFGLQDRASTLTRVDKSHDAAVVMLGQVKRLLDQQKTIETEAANKVKVAVGFQDSMAIDPFWQNILKANISVLGAETLGKAAGGARQAAAIASGLNDLRNRMNAHIGSVANIERSISDAEGYVQGRGVAATFDKVTGTVTGFYTGLLKWPLIVGAGVAAVSIFGIPTPRRHAAANPRRRGGRRRGRR